MLEEIQQASQFTEYLDSSSLTFIDYAELYAANNNPYKPEDFLSNPLLESLFLTTARISNLCSSALTGYSLSAFLLFQHHLRSDLSIIEFTLGVVVFQQA